MITKKEYILSKLLKEEYRYCFLARDKDGSLILHPLKPDKFPIAGRWIAPNGEIQGFLNIFTDDYIEENMFQCIKWEDENVKRVIDYIKEYEEWAEKKNENNNK